MELDNVTQIIAIRHGETDWNREARIQGHMDIGLSDVGRAQAHLLAEALRDETLHAIYASDLSRAFDTADALTRGRGLTVKVDAELRERHFGAFQGRTFVEIEAADPLAAKRWRERDPDFAGEGGETLRQFFSRCIKAVAGIAAQHPGQTLAIVAHGGVMDCLYRAASRIDLQAPRAWPTSNAAINRLLYTAQGLQLVGWNDVFHLESEALDLVDKS